MTGIYMIQNMVNGKIYVGQAVDIEKRWSHHKTALNGGYHVNKHLQASWIKYGADNFEFTVLAECDEDKLDELEVQYIAEFDSMSNSKGYNKESGGNKNKHASKETRKKISDNNAMKRPEARKKLSESKKGSIPWNKGKTGVYTKETRKSMGRGDKNKVKEKLSKPVIGINKDNGIIVEYHSMHDAFRQTGISFKNISACCRGNQKSAGGYYWMYAE